MGATKREMERREAQLDEGRDIAVEGGALKRCEFHPDVVWETFEDPEDAYKIANARFSSGSLLNDYKSRRELTDAIKAAIEQAGMDGCHICTKMLSD